MAFLLPIYRPLSAFVSNEHVLCTDSYFYAAHAVSNYYFCSILFMIRKSAIILFQHALGALTVTSDM
uniref:Uncharacterized protein n=1 Tax=Arundo donax TaxID=35708 RepID=A0A0A9BLF9_ARUDO